MSLNCEFFYRAEAFLWSNGFLVMMFLEEIETPLWSSIYSSTWNSKKWRHNGILRSRKTSFIALSEVTVENDFIKIISNEDREPNCHSSIVELLFRTLHDNYDISIVLNWVIYCSRKIYDDMILKQFPSWEWIKDHNYFYSSSEDDIPWKHYSFIKILYLGKFSICQVSIHLMKK